jgi:hypothetical protein
VNTGLSKGGIPLARRKKVKGKVGDIFMISLKTNKHCFGQIIIYSPEKYESPLCILFDFVAEEIPEIQSIIKKPILAIANINDFAINDGRWLIIGNAKVAINNLILPNCIEGLPLRVRSYDGNFIRYATEQDEKELKYKTDNPPLAFEYLARHKYEGGPWDGFYDDILFVNNKHRYVGSGELMQNDTSYPEYMKQEGEIQQFKEDSFCEDPDNIGNNYDEFTTIRIRYALSSDGFGTPEDLNRRHQIEDLLDDCLMETNNGECDGGEIGNGEMIIFCYVIDPEKAVETIRKELEKHGYLEGARISYEQE